jgi:O-antigen/teichoic acid export membrane protein
LVGDVVLTIYGEGFETGYYILLVLTFARLIYGYSRQFVSTIDALDYPNLTFRVNAAFVATNLIMNVLLTWRYGWYGAAVATTVSSGVALVSGYHYASDLLDIVIPVRQIAKQCASATIMAVVVFLGRYLLGDSLPVIIGLVGIGAGSYFFSLLTLSEEFRTTVGENLPVELPKMISK